MIFRTDAIPSGTTDLILTVTAPDGTELGAIDTGSSPEQLAAKLTQAGAYEITISGFDGDTGDFTVEVLPVTSPSQVTTDFNLLIFDGDGNFLGVDRRPQPAQRPAAGDRQPRSDPRRAGDPAGHLPGGDRTGGCDPAAHVMGGDPTSRSTSTRCRRR